MKTTVAVKMELLSDAIFGSGYAIPGGEDIAVCRDEKGYPYLKGSTFKGLLRESAEDLLVWTGKSEADLTEWFGCEDRSGVCGARRLRLTGLTLAQPPAAPEDCFDSRVFTALEDGVVKQGALRMAACIRRGLTFAGELLCEREDMPFLLEALSGIKWVGTLRSRGFGRVRVTGAERTARQGGSGNLRETPCIRYRLHTELPVLITNLSRSRDNSYDTRGYLPGSAIRGMVMHSEAVQALSSEEQAALLQVRFLDAVPCPTERPALPSLLGFYETKEGTELETVVEDGEFAPGKKRARLGTFCALEDDTIFYWSASVDKFTRIQRNAGREEDTQMFQTRCLSAGQDFQGYILLNGEEARFAPVIAQAFRDTVWLGADQYEGFGKCSVALLESAARPDWLDAYGFRTQEEIGSDGYLLAVSPLCMQDPYGDPCGLDEKALAGALGVPRVEICFCATSLAEYGGYRRAWRRGQQGFGREPAARFYERGSLFHLSFQGAVPRLEAIRAIQEQGLGIRRAEGFGQVLFLPPSVLKGLNRKEKAAPEPPAVDTAAAAERRARYRWIMEHSGDLRRDELSKSQLGNIQALCENCRNSGDLTALETYLSKNLEGRGARHGSRFRFLDELIRQTLSQPLSVTLHLQTCADSPSERLGLLCQLFNYSRKEAK